MKVILPIFWSDKETITLQDLGIDPPELDFEELKTRDLIFYDITAIYKFEGGDKYTRILTANDSFICAIPCNEVEKLIDKSMKYE